MTYREENLAMQYYRSKHLTPITMDNLMTRVVDLMMFVEKEPTIESGALKESVVIAVITREVGNSVSEDRVLQRSLVSALLPSIMDAIIRADKNTISINPKPAVGFGGILKLFSWFASCRK